MKKRKKPRSAKPTAFLITGVPASGKTTLARAWCRKHPFTLVSLNDVVLKYKLYSKTDALDGAKIVRLSALKTRVNSRIRSTKGPLVIEGHLGCEIPLCVDTVVVLRINPKILRTRLRKRKYSKSKMNQNLESEALDYCTILSEKNYSRSKIFELDVSSKPISRLILDLEKLILPNTCAVRANMVKRKISWANFFLLDQKP